MDFLTAEDSKNQNSSPGSQLRGYWQAALLGYLDTGFAEEHLGSGTEAEPSSPACLCLSRYALSPAYGMVRVLWAFVVGGLYIPMCAACIDCNMAYFMPAGV